MTIGNAFDSGFDNPTWQSFQTDRGERMVQFDGLISQKLHDNVVTNLDRQLNTLSSAQRIPHYSGMLTEVIENNSEDSPAIQQLNAIEGCNYSITGQQMVEGQVKNFYWTNCQGKDYQKFIDIMLTHFYASQWIAGTPVSVQWTIAVDGQSFSLTYLGSEAWAGQDINRILNEIYR